MARQLAKYGFYLIGGYLLLSYATGAGTLFTNAEQAGTGLIKTLQARG